MHSKDARQGLEAGTNSHNIIGIAGMRNLGNTCYMNSALQCLNRTTEITRYLTGPQHKQAFAAAEKDVAGASPVTSAFVNLLNGLWSKEVAGSGLCDTRTLQDFKTVIGKFAAQFAGYNQQDVSEFLAFLIDGLHEEMNEVRGNIIGHARNNM